MQLSRRTLITFAVALVLGALFVLHFSDFIALLKVILGALSPFIAGAIVAFLLNLIMVQWEKVLFPKAKHKILVASRRTLSIIISILTIALVVYLITSVTADGLVDAFLALKDSVTMLFERFAPQIMALPEVQQYLAMTPEEWFEFITSTLAEMGGIANVLVAPIFEVGMALGTGAVNAVIAIIFAIYLLHDKERCLAAGKTILELFLPEHLRKNVLHFLAVANECFSKFISGQCVEACILGCLCSICLAVLGFPYAFTVGLTVGFTAIVPLVGPWVGGVIGALMILSVSPIQAVWFVVFLLILQQVEGNLIYPHVVGGSMGVPSLWVLFAVFVGGALFGVLGFLIGVPMVATVRMLCIEHAENVRAKKAQAQEEGVEGPKSLVERVLENKPVS